MANTSARMLQLLSLLQTHRYWPGSDLADRLEVSERTLRRDIDRLRELGYPVDASRGVSGGYQLRSGAAMPPLLLDDEEAVAIAVGLRAAAGTVAGIEETSVRALTKVVQVMPPRLRRRIDALQEVTVPSALRPGPTIDALALTVLAQACRDDERLRFRYASGNADPTRRQVEPHRLVHVGRRWYLVAWDLERHDWRTFRVDRLSEPETTGIRFRQRALPADDAAEFVADRIASLKSNYAIEVIVHASAESARRIVGTWAALEELDASTCRLRIRTDELHWPALILIALEADFEVVGPATFTDYLRRTAGLLTTGISRSASSDAT